MVLAADEGPFPPRYAADEVAFKWLEATPEELLRKFSIFTAVSVPGADAADLAAAALDSLLADDSRGDEFGRVRESHWHGERVRRPTSKGDNPGAWTCVVMDDAAELFGTRGLVKIRGAIDGEPFDGALMAQGDGTHRLPVKATLRKAIGKEAGDTVHVRIDERIG